MDIVRFHIEYTALAINGRTARLFCDKSERICFVEQAQFPPWAGIKTLRP